MTIDTPRTDAVPKRYMTVVYEITEENEWRKTNPLRYAHNGLTAVRVCIDDVCELLDEAEAEVASLKDELAKGVKVLSTIVTALENAVPWIRTTLNRD